MGIFVMFLDYIINGKFSVLFHDIIFLCFRLSCWFLYLGTSLFFFQIGFYLNYHSVLVMGLELDPLKSGVAWQRCENVITC